MQLECKERTCVVAVDLLLHAFEQLRVLEKLEIILFDVVFRSQKCLVKTIGSQMTKLVQLQQVKQRNVVARG